MTPLFDLRLIFIAALLLVLGPWSAGPAFAAATPPEEAADLVYMNRMLHTMRVTIAGVSPEARVERALERLRSLEQKQRLMPVVATAGTWDGEQSISMSVDDRTLFTVFARDIDPEAGTTLEQVAENAKVRLQEALAASHQMAQPGVLLRGVAVSGAGLIAVLLGWWVARRGIRRLARLLQGAVAQEAAARRWLGIDWTEYGYRIVGFGSRAMAFGAFVLLAYLLIGHTLRQFPATQPLALGMRRWTTGQLFDAVALIWSVLPNLGMCLLIVLIARAVAWFLGSLFDGVAAGRFSLPGVHAETASATRSLAVFAVWGFALAAAYPYIPGSNTDIFRGLSVFLGFMITLGSSGVVSQWMHGLVITYSRALRCGDFVRIGAVEGVVTELSALAVKIVDYRNDEITLPNSTVIAGSMINYTRLGGDGFVHGWTKVSIGYDVPWRQVHALLQDAAQRTPGVVARPAAQVLQRGLSDFYVEYELICQLDPAEPRAYILSRLHASIRDVFEEAGVEILSPHYEAQIEVEPTMKRQASPAEGSDGVVKRGRLTP